VAAVLPEKTLQFYIFCLVPEQLQSEPQPVLDENDFVLRRIICPMYASAPKTIIATMID